MAKVLIGYNSDVSDPAKALFEACADEAKQICVDAGCDFEVLTTPNLTNQNVVNQLGDKQVFFVTAHGASDAVLNEKDEEVVSTRTTNYGFKDKGFYSVSCYTAKSLKDELQRIGVLLYVGYDDTFISAGDTEPFCECAMEGLRQILSGTTLAEARTKMKEMFEAKRKVLEKVNSKAAKFLVHDKIHLCFEGDDGLTINDLK